MKSFAEWMATGPLSFERITARERLIAELAYMAGASEQIDENRAALDRILHGEAPRAQPRAS